MFTPNNFRDVQNLYQDKTSMKMSLNDFSYLTSPCWNINCTLLTVDMMKDKYQGRYRQGLN